MTKLTNLPRENINRSASGQAYMRWWLICGLLFLAACSAESFEAPEIKDDFCGVEINYQYCKCAFHNEFCDAIGMDKSGANAYVHSEYDAWVDELLADWLAACALAGGIPGEDDCTYCDEGLIVQNGECVLAEDVTESEFKPDGPLNDDCTIKQEEFDRDWRKYSDIDDVIPYNERSYEAKQAVDTYDQMIELMVRGFQLERDIEIEEQMQAELEAYKEALVQDLKTNLLKAFWRLSWVTYSTVKSGTGLGESYSQVLTSGGAVESIGAGLKVVQGVIPGDSALAIDTSTTAGKAASVGANTALEAIDGLGDPTKIATELFKSAANAPLPSADLTPDEIAVLKEQHLQNGVVDAALEQSIAVNAQRKLELASIEDQITTLQAEIDSWEGKEKERVRVMLEESCKELAK